MDIDRALTLTGISQAPDLWRDSWEQAQLAFPCVMSGLIGEDIITQATALDLPSGFIDGLRDAVAFIRNNEGLYRLAWLWHYLIFEYGGNEPIWYPVGRKKRQLRTRMLWEIPKWPQPTIMPEALSGMFIAIIVFTGVPRMLAEHSRLGIPYAISLDTLSDIAIWADDYRAKNGKWGFENITWLLNHLTGSLFRLGRLEFIPSIFTGNYIAFKNPQSAEVIAFAGEDIRFRSDGHVDGTNGIADTESGWTSKIERVDGRLTGSPVTSDGIAIKDQTTIMMDEWQEVLQNDCGILDVHIPAGARLEYSACIESFRMANEFFPKYFPEHSYSAFFCDSWLLDHALGIILTPDSNIVRFLKEFYTLPSLSDARSTYERVFGNQQVDITKAPRDSSLRRAVVEHVLAGNQVHSALGFIPADEIGAAHNYFTAKQPETQ